MLKELTSSLTHLLFPQLCAGCTRPLIQHEETLCLSCNLALPRTSFHTNPNNDAVARFAGRIPFQHATAFCYFTPDGLLQHLLHRLKYKKDRHIGTYLGLQFGHDLQSAPWIHTIDAIVPVPLHKKKEQQRGYNQSAEIAKSLGVVLGKPVYTDAISRTRPTESQTRKSRDERFQNVHDAFKINNLDSIRNKHILLVDDVLTTGATLEAAATALVQPGGVQVSLAAIGLAAI